MHRSTDKGGSAPRPLPPPLYNHFLFLMKKHQRSPGWNEDAMGGFIYPNVECRDVLVCLCVHLETDLCLDGGGGGAAWRSWQLVQFLSLHGVIWFLLFFCADGVISLPPSGCHTFDNTQTHTHNFLTETFLSSLRLHLKNRKSYFGAGLEAFLHYIESKKCLQE